MTAAPLKILVSFIPARVSGLLEASGDKAASSIWDRLKSRAVSIESGALTSDTAIELPWQDVLDVVRQFGSRQAQQTLNFRLVPSGEAAQKIADFVSEFIRTRQARNTLTVTLTRCQIAAALREKGFTKRELKEFQLRDLERLLSIPHGANFSVPGSGKTTVSLALHILISKPGQHLFVVGPKTSFVVWREIVNECMSEDAPDGNAEPFTFLDRSIDNLDDVLRSGARRFVISYDLMIREQSLLTSYFARQPVHLLLDESHRMKAGVMSQRGAYLLNIASLPIRRDILTGTPMPQGPADLASQLSFLWPGHGLDLEIQRGTPPREVLGNLYVRTTKRELRLPPVKRQFHHVEMSPAHLALYGIVRNESLRQLSLALKSGNQSVDFLSARKSVMRLLQLSVNPLLALKGIADDLVRIESGLVDAVLDEGPSQKMRAVADFARKLAHDGAKSVIWTIFTDTLVELERMLADLNPVTLYGAVPTGEPTDMATREGRLRRFHEDSECRVLIANPAAAGEGISLHTVCHNALYLDRSYVSTHYLQSLDRVHRLGLDPDILTQIHIFQTKAPPGLGSIDMSVSRRLAVKLRALQTLLDDPDLHEIALDEELADDPVDYDVDLQDLVDLVKELEGHAQAKSEEADA